MFVHSTHQLEIYYTGDPPEFTSNPQDQFVFERDADGNPVTLTFMCPVTGSPNITYKWSAPQVQDTLASIVTTKHLY